MTDLLAGLPGAVADDDGILLHLGNPFAEQRALVNGTAVALLRDRAVLAVTGVDRLSWLDSVTSQALAHLAPGVSTELLVLDDGETTWLIVDRADAEPLLGWLTRMRFRLRVDLRAADDLVVFGAADAALDGLPAAAPAGVPLVWHDPWPEVSAGGAAYAADEDHPGRDRDWNEVLVTADDARRIYSQVL